MRVFVLQLHTLNSSLTARSLPVAESSERDLILSPTSSSLFAINRRDRIHSNY